MSKHLKRCALPCLPLLPALAWHNECYTPHISTSPLASPLACSPDILPARSPTTFLHASACLPACLPHSPNTLPACICNPHTVCLPQHSPNILPVACLLQVEKTYGIPFQEYWYVVKLHLQHVLRLGADGMVIMVRPVTADQLLTLPDVQQLIKEGSLIVWIWVSG